MIKKITLGYVTQEWDEKEERWVRQYFTAGDRVEYENELGEPVEPIYGYLKFDMVQPIVDDKSVCVVATIESLGEFPPSDDIIVDYVEKDDIGTLDDVISDEIHKQCILYYTLDSAQDMPELYGALNSMCEQLNYALVSFDVLFDKESKK